jgi:hypothetical protein
MRTFLTFTFLLAGCTGDLVELGPKTGGTGGADMAQATGAAGGGGTSSGGDMAGGTTGGAVTFVSIQADLDAKICSSSACHGSANTTSNGGFELKAMATAAADLMANYTAVQSEINTMTPATSPLLTNPAGLATPAHGGGTIFTAGTADPTYQKWLAWIMAGAPEGTP